MLELDVLVHGAFGTVAFVAALHGAGIVPLDFIRRPSVPLPLVVVEGTAHHVATNRHEPATARSSSGPITVKASSVLKRVLADHL